MWRGGDWGKDGVLHQHDGLILVSGSSVWGWLECVVFDGARISHPILLRVIHPNDGTDQI